MDPSELFVPSEAKDEATEITTSHTTPKLDMLKTEPTTSFPTSSHDQSATAKVNNETLLPPHKRSPIAVKVESGLLASVPSLTREGAPAAMSTEKPANPVTVTDESKLPPHKRILQAAAKEEVGESSNNSKAQVNVDTSCGTGNPGPSKTSIKDETSVSAAGTDAATNKWLDSFDNQTTTPSPNDHGPSVAAEGESLISFASSPQVENANPVPIPPAFIPVKAPDAPAAPATSTEPTESYEGYAVPKNEKDLASAFMKAAQSKLSGFTTKYGSDPEADTRKELAAPDQALKNKLGPEDSGPQNVIEHLGKASILR